MEGINSTFPLPRKKIDPELFWMLFALACVLIILYMAYDFRTSVEAATESITLSKCNNILLNKTLNISIR